MLDQVIRGASRRFGDATAYEGWDTTLSYGDLDQRSDALAGALVAEGLRPGDVVALRLPSGADYLIAYGAVGQGGRDHRRDQPEARGARAGGTGGPRSSLPSR